LIGAGKGIFDYRNGGGAACWWRNDLACFFVRVLANCADFPNFC
jgi:hypothetical protein